MARKINNFIQNKINISCEKIEHNVEHAISVINRVIKDKPDIEDAFFVLNLQEVARRFYQIKRLLPRVEQFYAMKCNSRPEILNVMASLGCHFECASQSEIEYVLTKLKTKPENIIFANPVKPVSHLKFVANNKVPKMTFDSEYELAKIAEYYPDADVVLRLRCDDELADFSLGVKFGCDPETEGPTLIDACKKLGLNLIGIAFHVGVGCRDSDVYDHALKYGRTLFDHAKTVGYNCYFVDIGGGFPGSGSSDINPLVQTINTALDAYFPKETFPNLRIISEFGQYYAAASCTLVTNILGKKWITNNNNISNGYQNGDGNSKGKLTYYIGETVYKAFIVALCEINFPEPHPLNQEKYQRASKSNVTIRGCTVDDRDVIYSNALMPEMQTGEWIYFTDMGAYSIACDRHYESMGATQLYPIIDVETYKKVINSEKKLLKQTDFVIVE